MLRTVFLDKQEDIYKSLGDLVKTPKGALAFVSEFTDRTEGRAKQMVDHNVRRSTTFAPAPTASLDRPSEAAAETVTGDVGPDGERMVRLRL
jgi:hypothetical protein